MTASSSRLHAHALALTLLLSAPALAHADAPAPPTEAQIEAARALYKEARELHKQGKLKEAIDRALEAYRTAATPVTALEAGSLLVEAGRLVEARDLLRGVALLAVSPRESSKGREARQDAATLAASLDARIPKVAVADRPRGADVFLDGKPLAAGDSNAWVGIDPGPHTIVVKVGDRTCATITATLAETEERTIDLHDAAKTCAPETPPVATQPLPAPSASTTTRVIAPPPPSAAPIVDGASTRRWIGVAIGGAGVVAVAVGGIVALGAKSDYDAVASSCTARGCSHAAFDARDAARSRGDVATVTMILGGAVAAAGAVVFFWPNGDTRANVAVGANGVRLNVRW